MSFRTLFILPYVALTLTLAALVGWLSYRAGDQSVQQLAQRLSAETAHRIGETTVAYLDNWRYVLEAANVDRLDANPATTLRHAEDDLWHASGVSSVRPSYVYMATSDGRFVGIQRPETGPPLLKWRDRGDQPKRELYLLKRLGDRSQPLGLENEAFDARERPWYVRAAARQDSVWSPVYLDHDSRKPMVTLTRAHRDTAGAVSYVLGADVPLAYLQSFLRRLSLIDGGLAFVMTREGQLIAHSVDDALPIAADGRLTPATQHGDRLLALAAATVPTQLPTAGVVQAGVFDDTQAGRHLVSAMSVRAAPGLDWWIVVSLPEAALMAEFTGNAYRTAALALLACLVAVGIGVLILRRLAGGIDQFARAAETVSLDSVPQPLSLGSSREMSRLAGAFNRMTQRLASANATVQARNTALSQAVADLEHQITARDSADGRLRRLADALQEGLIVIDRDWRVTFANARASRYLNTTEQTLMGADLRALYPALERSVFGLAIERAFRTNQPLKVEGPSPTVAEAWAMLRLYPTPFGLAGFFVDVTGERLAREALADREQQLSRLAAELLRSQSEERRAIAQELHDEFGQALGALRINLQMISGGLAPDAPEQARLHDSLDQATHLLAHVRDRALDLHPAVLDDLGLHAALQWWCERQAARSGVAIELQCEQTVPRLDDATELACFRIVQEALGNALRHARPHGVKVTLSLDSALRLSVVDDGCGLPDGVDAPGAVRESLGLTTMRERAQQLGGTLRIDPVHPHGTAVHLVLPLRSPES
jgi:signal transduction histidine kinase